MRSPYRAPESSHRYVLDTVRSADRDRFLAALFAPETARRGLMALLAFDHELARARTVTREALLAEIRLEWWREAATEAAGPEKPRAQPVVEALSEAARHHGLTADALIALIDARAQAIEGPLDVVRTGAAFADLELAILDVSDAATRKAAHAVAAAGLMAEGPERGILLSEARGLARKVDPAALPVLLQARLLDQPMSPWRKPLVLWWAARRGRW